MSVPSGIGGWDAHYVPLLRDLDAGPYLADHDLPEILQLFASDELRARSIFDVFRHSFYNKGEPNPYHYAILKAAPERIWTTNYDGLFEKAQSTTAAAYRTVKTNQELLDNFGDSRTIVKMNGDFEGAHYDDKMDWNIVFTEEQFDLADRRRREVWRLFEDDYRNKSIVFVGVSFKDPSLRRIIAAAVRNIPRTRYPHYILMREALHPSESYLFDLYKKYLARYGIEILLFQNFPDIERFVRQIAIVANRPIVSFSGSINGAGPLDGGSIDAQTIGELCKQLGRSLAQAGLRVTSGHGSVVGVESVEAAFEADPLAARFYLRSRGKSVFSRTAPAIVVPGESLETVRERFIGECSLMVAIGGGDTPDPETGVSGTVSEIQRARKLQIPVLIVKQAGGAAGAFSTDYIVNLDAFYQDKTMVSRIREENLALQEVKPEDLNTFFASSFPGMIERVLAASMGSSTSSSNVESSSATW